MASIYRFSNTEDFITIVKKLYDDGYTYQDYGSYDEFMYENFANVDGYFCSYTDPLVYKFMDLLYIKTDIINKDIKKFYIISERKTFV